MIQAAGDLRTLWFMGAKTRLIDGFIDGAVRDMVPAGATVLDLCAGTAVVGRRLAPQYRIFANDVQSFATTVARAHLEGDVAWREALESLDPVADLERAFQSNFECMQKFVAEPLAVETDTLPRVVAELGARNPGGATHDYRRFLEVSPTVQDPARGRGSLFSSMEPLFDGFLRERRQDPFALPFGMFALYYQNVYFGLRQSLVIDAFRAAIARIPTEDPFVDRKRTIYLAALLHAISISTSGTSHFAQPRSLRKDTELLAVARRRSIDIDLEFHRALDAIRREWAERPQHFDHRAFQGEGEALLAEGSALGSEAIDLVYLDPPYTSDNYSRFYHVLETLVQYDYPELEHRAGRPTRGIYPALDRRYQSRFCRADGVEAAFREVAQRAAARGAALLVSYSEETGLLLKSWRRKGETNPLGRFGRLFRDSFDRVEIRDRELMHSGQGDSNLKIRELLVLCESPKCGGAP